MQKSVSFACLCCFSVAKVIVLQLLGSRNLLRERPKSITKWTRTLLMIAILVSEKQKKKKTQLGQDLF